MGAWDRRFENRIEKELAEQKTKGILEAPSAYDNGYLVPPTQWVAGDRRALIPPLGLREYWYPALPASKVGSKPLFWIMLGDEMVFFRDAQGEVVALTDVCPHRGASLSEGDCFYKGFVTCPYHGACFDGRGECAAFLTEGPDSRMVGELRARTYPTRTLRGWVFVWMGDGAPAPLEEDVPPEFFEPETSVLCSSYSYWYTNWLVAIENQMDAHNCFFVHRNCVKQLTGIHVGRPRTPLGPRSKVVNGRALTGLSTNRSYYAKDGQPAPYQMYYPGVDGVWPLHRWRLLWRWFFMLFNERKKDYETSEEWSSAHHLPCAVRVNYGKYMYTRYAVPVKPNLSRILYFHHARRDSALARLGERTRFFLFHNWSQNYNFSAQDDAVASPCRWFTPEYLSPTDSHLVALRKLILEGSRDALRRKAGGNGHASQPAAEQLSVAPVQRETVALPAQQLP
jgi:phenylpropionate dioxygenase-like ring-hydroxylating dioxygenase large terminal subunit